MKFKRKLQDLNEKGTQNFRDEAYDECRVFSLNCGNNFEKKFPKWSSYKDLFVKMVFINSYSDFLQNKLYLINSLEPPAKKRKRILKGNLISLISYLKNVTNIFLIRTLRPVPELATPRIGIELSEGIRPPLYRSDINFDLLEFGADKFVFFDFQKVINRYKDEESAYLLKCLDMGTIVIALDSKIKHKNIFIVKNPLIKKFFFSTIDPHGTDVLFFEYLPFLILAENFWKHLFRKLKIRGWLHTVEFPLENLLQVKLIQELGGVSFSRQRSEAGSVKGLFYQPADILFNWSHYSNENFQELNLYKCIKSIGHVYLKEDAVKTYKTFGEDLRRKFTNDSFILSIYDNVTGDLTNISKENFNLFIRFILDLLKENKNVGVIFKLKKNTFIDQYPYRNEIEDAIKEKRILLFEGYLLPVALGFASDLAIGVGSSSPIWEINITGRRGIYLWPGVGSTHVITGEKLKHLVCRNIEDVKIKIETLISSPDSDVGLVSSDAMKFFVEYNDFKGPDRIRFCFKKLLEKNYSREEYINWIRTVDLEKV